jgi:prephenate dehydratase/chorismate mutase
MSEEKKREADEMREQVRGLDAQFTALLEKRAQVVAKLGALRVPGALPSSFEEVAPMTPGTLAAQDVRTVMRAVHAACAALEVRSAVVFAGAEGSPACRAAQSRFGVGATLLATKDVATALEEVQAQRAGFAVVPYETRPYGPVDATIRELLARDLRIVACFEAREVEERVRYAVVAQRPSTRTGHDLTALVFSLHDTPGALQLALARFAEREINLTKIESRSNVGGGSDAWDYLFFVELVGHATDRHVLMALDDLRRQTRFCKVLGSYAHEVG